jgi:hypothetical protein
MSTTKIDAIVKRAYAYLDQFYTENEKDPATETKKKSESSKDIEIPKEELVLPDDIIPVTIPKKIIPVTIPKEIIPVTIPKEITPVTIPKEITPKELSKRFVYLRGKSGREIIEIIQKECGVHITIGLKSKERIVKKAKEILKEHGLGVVL